MFTCFHYSFPIFDWLCFFFSFDFNHSRSFLYPNWCEAQLRLCDITQSIKRSITDHFCVQVMREVVELYREELVPDYIQMAQCLIFLNDSGAVAGMLDTLLNTVGQNKASVRNKDFIRTVD